MPNRSVAGIAIRDGRALVARRLPGGDLGGKWEFPGGKLESGEDDQAALTREFDEELNARLRVLGKLGESGFFHHGKEYRLAAWRIDLLPGELTLREHKELRWVDGGELEALELADSDRSLLPFVLPLLA